MLNIRERFDKNYIKNLETKCWEWAKSSDKDGYGYFKVNNKTKKAHRISYSLHYGEIPQGKWVLHKCDNPNCVNPEHLFIGDAEINSNDKVTKNRQYKGFTRNHSGIKNPKAKLSEQDVQWIRENYKWGLGPTFAKKFNVHPFHINRIVRGERWSV